MKKVFSLLTTFAILISMVVVPTAVSAATTYWTDEGIVATAFAGGSGTETDPYEIATPAQLAKIAADANGSADGKVCSGVYYELTADIDLAGHDWVPIANVATKFFAGKIIGNGHIIKNMTITCSYPVIGFIGSGSDALALSDLGFVNANISYNNMRTPDGTMVAESRCSCSGIVIAYERGGTYANVFVRDSVLENKRGDTSEKIAGGFVGAGVSEDGGGDSKSTRKIATFTNCYVTNTKISTLTTSGSAFQSGFVGLYKGDTNANRIKFEFTNCYTADVTITGPNPFAFICYINVVNDQYNYYSATNVFSTSTNTSANSSTVEIATLNATKDDIETAVTADGSMVTDKMNINSGYPVCEWEAYWIWDGTTATAFEGGTGTEKDPYLISNGAQLSLLANNVYNAISTTTSIPVATTSTAGLYNAYTNTYFRLTADIDLNGEEWIPIGRDGMRFNGHFDGAGHVISNVKISEKYYYAMGLFGATGRDASVSNTGVENVNITWTNNSTGAADYVSGGDASFTACTRNRGEAAGALIGIIGGGEVKNSYARNVTINASSTNSTAVEWGVGGLIGGGRSTEGHDVAGDYKNNEVLIENCYVVNATVSSNRVASAFLGKNGNNSTDASRCEIMFKNCYVGGNVAVTSTYSTPTQYNFALSTGANDKSGTEKCYTISTADADAVYAATVATKGEIITNVVDRTNYYGDNSSSNINDGYPILAWQKTWEEIPELDSLKFSDITSENAREIKSNLTLADELTVDGVTYGLSWASSDPDIVALDGTVTAELFDKDIVLVATSDVTGSSKTFNLTVLGEVTKALNNALGTQTMGTVTSDIALPASVICVGTSYPVEWRTSNSGVITADGKVSDVVSDTAVSLTAYANSESQRYDMVVAADMSTIKTYVEEDFDAIADGTDISRYTGWENPIGTDGKTDPGVNYTVTTDPANISNKVVKVERYYGVNGSLWYNNGVVQTDTNGPSRNETAMFVVDSDSATDGNQPITSGKLQISAKMKFETAGRQRMSLWVDNLGNGRDRSCFDIIFNGNNAAINFADTYGTNDVYLQLGTSAVSEWYDIVLVLDLDADKYEMAITRESGSTYKKSGNLDVNESTPASISRIGIRSNVTSDQLADGTLTSVWYVDDFSIKDITLSNADAVAYDKATLSVETTVSADMILPTSGANGTTVSWKSGDTSVITDDGKVTFKTTDQTVKLTATVSKGKEALEKEFTVTVKAKDYYEVKGIVVTDGETSGNALVNNGTVTAVEIINNISKAGKLYVALYENDRFVSVSTEDLSENAQSSEIRTITLTEPITLPTDVSECEVKAFVWDNNLERLSEAYTSSMPDTTLWMLGDSIMTIYADTSYPQTGWGMVVGDYLSDRVTIENRAHGGWTTATYLDSTSYDALANFVDDIAEGDYAVIGLGINDANAKNNISIEQYETNYRAIAQAIIDRGATPILTTPTIVTTENETAPNPEKYSEHIARVKKVANDMRLVCIDITAEMDKRFDAEIASGKTMENIRDAYYLWDPAENGWDLSGSTIESNKRDGVHINENGAKLVADIFTDLLKSSTSKLGAYVK